MSAPHPPRKAGHLPPEGEGVGDTFMITRYNSEGKSRTVLAAAQFGGVTERCLLVDNVSVSGGNAITRTGEASAFLKRGNGTLHLNGTGTLNVNTKTDNSGSGSNTVTGPFK